MVFSGINDKANLVEIIEIPKLKHFIACQFHPEFKSRPLRPAPLFDSFIKKSIGDQFFLTFVLKGVIIFPFTKPAQGRVKKYKTFQRTLLGEKEDV